ncbi:DUF2637 domain-containing protein [Streptomyces hawaiiensis]|uniref:DUF2637 domain-containing protein n=1 Tax=Streptomyces hawaiiensis TaxID=67305 RepID=UPI0036663A75
MRARLSDPILIQSVIAAALSFAHIHDLAEAAGQAGWKAWAYPVSVDLLMVMAWKQMRTPGAPKGGPWCWFLLSLAASLGANVATSGVMDLENVPASLRVLVAGWPAVAFLGGAFMMHSRTPETADKEPQEPAGGHVEEPEEEEVPEPVPAPHTPNLVTYAEAASVAGVAVETIRGAANGDRPRLSKFQTTEGPRVDLDEVRKVYGKRPVGV